MTDTPTDAATNRDLHNPGGEYYRGLRCGVEDRDIADRYEAAEYGWDQAFEYIETAIAHGFLISPDLLREVREAIQAVMNRVSDNGMAGGSFAEFLRRGSCRELTGLLAKLPDPEGLPAGDAPAHPQCPTCETSDFVSIQAGVPCCCACGRKLKHAAPEAESQEVE